MSLHHDVLPHKQLRHVVYEYLRTAILDGTLKSGEWLRQKRIAEELGVSQMPVREALKELVADGLVEHIPYRGVRVIEFSLEDVVDLYAHRGFLEGMAARVAAQKITPEELDELRDLRAQMERNLAQDRLSEYRHLNRRFHQVVYSASRRDYLVRTLNQLWSAFPMMLLSNYPGTATQALPESDDKDHDEHDGIIAALERGDGDEAERLVRHHIEGACRLFVSVLNYSDDLCGH
jgi:DNA-binding GntR family transcriptional regulator